MATADALTGITYEPGRYMLIYCYPHGIRGVYGPFESLDAVSAALDRFVKATEHLHKDYKPDVYFNNLASVKEFDKIMTLYESNKY